MVSFFFCVFFFFFFIFIFIFFFFFQAEDGIRDHCVTGVQTCALPIYGQALLNQGRFSEAQKQLNKALQLQPENVEAYMQLATLYKEQGEFEQMVTLNGPRREIIRENGTVKCQLKEDTAFMVQQAEYATPFEITSPEQLKQLKQHYKVELGGRDRVADMPVQRINVKPKDQYRFGYHLWIADQNNHMLLRAEMVDEHGTPLEQVMFTSLKLMNHLPEELTSVVNQQSEFTFVKESNNPKVDNNYQQRWVVTSMPPGFEQELARDYKMPEKQVMVEHQLFSDGFSSVSVFIEDSDKANKGNIQTRRAGPVTFVSKFYDDCRVTVVGEVPHVTAKLIATSTKRAGQD